MKAVEQITTEQLEGAYKRVVDACPTLISPHPGEELQVMAIAVNLLLLEEMRAFRVALVTAEQLQR